MVRSRSMVFELPEPEKVDRQHPLNAEAQAENLRSAWAHYRKPKAFKPGDLCREWRGLAIFIDDPVLLFVRALDPESAADNRIIKANLRKERWHKINCIVMRVHDSGGCSFFPHDTDLLEAWDGVN